jgi:hypothetical protein
MSARSIDMAGQRFGRLLVVKRTGLTSDRSAIWLCECDCGSVAHVPRHALARGLTKSCGCLAKETLMTRLATAQEANTKHGQSKSLTKLYRAWGYMNTRCYNKNCISFKNYGGRGIQVHPEWRLSFLAFAEHIGEPPTSKHSVDRIDVNGNYEPGNVRWATPSEQAKNRRRTA